MTRPISYPEWATSPAVGDVTDPGAPRKLSGWTLVAGIPEKPPYQTFNWWQENVYRWIAYLGGISEGAPTTLTIAAGAIVPVNAVHLVETTGGGASSNLTNITTTNTGEGRTLALRALDDTHTVVLKHEAGGAGQLHLANGLDCTMDTNLIWVVFIRIGADWYEQYRSTGPTDVVPDATNVRKLGATGKDFSEIHGRSLDGTGTLVVGGKAETTQIDIGHAGIPVNFYGSLNTVYTTSTYVSNAIEFAGIVTISNATASTTSATGALKVAGGVGIAGALFGGSTATFATSVSTPSLINGTSGVAIGPAASQAGYHTIQGMPVMIASANSRTSIGGPASFLIGSNAYYQQSDDSYKAYASINGYCHLLLRSANSGNAVEFTTAVAAQTVGNALTTGTTIASATHAGAWTFPTSVSTPSLINGTSGVVIGTAASNGTTAIEHKISGNGRTALTIVGSSDTSTGKWINFNETTTNKAQIGVTGSGSDLLLTSAALGSLCIWSNNVGINFSASPTAVIQGTLAPTGEWTWGIAGTTTAVLHTMNGGVAIVGSCSIKGSGASYATYCQAWTNSSNQFLGDVDNSSQWEFGLPGNNISHLFNGYLSVNGGGTSGSATTEHPYLACKTIKGTLNDPGSDLVVAHGISGGKAKIAFVAYKIMETSYGYSSISSIVISFDDTNVNAIGSTLANMPVEFFIYYEAA